MAEQLICNQQVVGSTPTVGFINNTFMLKYTDMCYWFLFGRIPEWPKGTDCKSAGTAFEGSNPSPPTRFWFMRNKSKFFEHIYSYV
jgi:hypothetical protein